MNRIKEKNEQIENIMESYYRYIGYYHSENIIKELDAKSDEINQIEIPSGMEKRFEKFSKKQQRKNKLERLMKKSRNIVKYAAVFIVCILLIGTAVTCTVEAFRVKILNFFIETHEKYTTAEINEDAKNAIPSSWRNYYYPRYLPENFVTESVEAINEKKIIQFVNGDQFILMTQSPNGTNYQIDTENAKVSEITINGQKGLIVEKGEIINIIWHNQECSFNFISNITRNELIEVIKSLEKK